MPVTETIAAIATGAAAAGIGIVRVSGARVKQIAIALIGRVPAPRRAIHARFRDAAGETIDDGLALFFPSPRSYTGEDVLELQAHGSPLALRVLLARCIECGARAARPGEFSERAFLNGRLDLAQAEAVADLIAAGSEAAARAARRSLDGAFSHRVEALIQALTTLRVYVEAAIDFPEEEVDFLSGGELAARLAQACAQLDALLAQAQRGRRLVDGLHAVIVGPPNAGKSSLLNALAGNERAIVTDIAGTTRDLLHETIRLDGVALGLVDTAGLREAGDAIEAEGMRRARAELARADLALAVLDAREPESGRAALAADLAAVPRVLWLHNKCDLSGDAARVEQRDDGPHLWLSATHGVGLDALIEALRTAAGAGENAGGAFSARARHVEALQRARTHCSTATGHLCTRTGELAAEELRLAQDALGEITGRISSDILLGRIFSSFCIGK